MQMCKILLSINPQHVENIMHGTKKYEYRKIMCKKNIDKILIYATCPVQKVVGEAEVLDILEMDKEDLWNLTKGQSGISKKFYNQYYKGRKTAIAYKLGDVIEYDVPMGLNEYGIKVAPQSYVYLIDNPNER